MTQDLSTAIGRVRERIARACERAGRDVDAVQLISVSKGHPVASIRAAYDVGMRVFGENYAQELAEKASILGDLEGLRVAVLGGRAHYYETGDAAAMRVPLETLAALGARRLDLIGCEARHAG